MEEDEVAFRDRVCRAYGILTNCVRIDAHEFMLHMADVKLGVASGILNGTMQELNDLIVAMRPANINRLNGAPLGERERDVYRAEYTRKALRAMQ